MGHEALLKSTVAASLAWDDNHERQIDRIVAIAYTKSDLGSLLLRVEALDAASLRKCVLLIARNLKRHGINRNFGERIAVAVLRETMQPGCVRCGGVGELHRDAEAVVSCHSCSGTGLQRYTDNDRTALMGGAFNKKAYEAAMGYVRDALEAVVRQANNRLTNR